MTTQHAYYPSHAAALEQPGPYMVYEPQFYPPRKKRTGMVVAIVVASALVLAGLAAAAFFVARGQGLFKDSGVAACQQLRDHSDEIVTGKEASAGGSDAADYHAARRMFSNSRYGDLRDAGTKLVDLGWQIEQMDSITPAEQLILAGQAAQDYSSLAGACANHGVDLPPMAK